MTLVAPSPVDARRWPAICYLQMLFPRTSSGHFAVGSGCLIGERVILTAGHNVFDPARGGKVETVQVVFGGGDRTPIGAVAVDTTAQWVETAHLRDPLSVWDFGVVVLPDDLDHGTDPLPFEATGDAEFDGMRINVAGYPSNPPSPHELGELFGANSGVSLDSRFSGRLFYPIATTAGMSGGPTYDFNEESEVRTVRGVHTSFAGRGSALRITADVAELVEAWFDRFES